MTDNRELLELAALACGFEIVHNMGLVARKDTGRYWNPAEDDGDCARMNVQLRIGTLCHSVCVTAWREWLGRPENILNNEFYSDHNSDESAAWRMASLRAAAEIGKRIREAQG